MRIVYSPQSLATFPTITAHTGREVNIAFHGTDILYRFKMKLLHRTPQTFIWNILSKSKSEQCIEKVINSSHQYIRVFGLR